MAKSGRYTRQVNSLVNRMLPFTLELLKVTDAAAQSYGISFETQLRSELQHVLTVQSLGSERQQQIDELLEAFSNLRSHDFEMSYAATETVMQRLYELSEVIPRELVGALDKFGTIEGALSILFFAIRPAPTSVIVDDWLCDVVWRNPNSLITYSQDEGRFHLVRPNSHGRLSIEAAFLGTQHHALSVWIQFDAIRRAVTVAEQLYREGRVPATRGARMASFENW